MRFMRLLVLFTLFVFSANLLSAADLTWHTFNEGMTKAKAEGKYVLVDFYTEWCGWCKKMDADTYTDTKVIEKLQEDFVLVKINPEKDGLITYNGETFEAAQFAQAAGVEGYPATAFFASDETFLEIVPGYLPPDKFMQALDYVTSGLYKQFTYSDYSAYRYLVELSKSNPGDTDLSFLIGFFNHKLLNKPEVAQGYYNKVVITNPEYGEAYYLLAELIPEEEKTAEYEKKAADLGIENADQVENKVRELAKKYFQQ